MTVDQSVEIRSAAAADVGAVCAFGRAHIPAHYAPLIGAEAAERQVASWWSEEAIRTAIERGVLLVATVAGRVVGVAQWGTAEAGPVIYKLYVDPTIRGQGLGPRLVDAVIAAVPPDATRLGVEHFAANARAGQFYEREGFAVERVDPHPDDPRLDVVWRSRALAHRR